MSGGRHGHHHPMPPATGGAKARPDLIMLGGWAHPAGALQPLADAVREFAAPRLAAAHEACPTPAQPAFLLGWSLGGLLALREALAAPERWLGLILVGSCARFCAAPDYPCGVAPARLRALQTALRRNPAAALGPFFADVAAPQALAPAASAAQVRAALALGTDALAAGLETLRTLDLRPYLRDCAKPVLILHGREDRVIPAAAGEWLAGQFTYSRFVPVAEAGHDVPARAPDILAAEIQHFLNTF